jgi:hypothetical protein
LENETTPSDAETADKQASPQEKLAGILSALVSTSEDSHSEIKGIRSVIETQSTAVDSLIDIHEEILKLYPPLLEDPAQVKTLFPYLINVIEGKLQFHFIISRIPEPGDPVDPTWMKVVERVPVQNENEFNVVAQVISPSYQTTVKGEIKTRRVAQVIATETTTEPRVPTTDHPIETIEEPTLLEAAKRRFSVLRDKLFLVTVLLSFLINIVLFALLMSSDKNNDSTPNINQPVKQLPPQDELPNSEPPEEKLTPAQTESNPGGESEPTPDQNPTQSEENSAEAPQESN